jgi:L-lactate dehydrogenase (cytochrome)
MHPSRCLNLHDFEQAARRRLPRAIFEFIAKGSEDGESQAANREAFRRVRLVPRVLRDTSRRGTDCIALGLPWSAPFGVAPMGALGVAGFQADLALARACREEGIPFVLSGASLVRLERVAAENAGAWFQMYPSQDESDNRKLIERLRAAGFAALVVTVDVPVGGNRENDARNGYSSPLRPSPRLVADALLHPRWLCGALLRTLLAEGLPQFENYGSGRAPMFGFRPARAHRRDTLSWDWLRRLREDWPGRLVLKGLLAPEDAAAAAQAGIDAVIVSNHGGRQLDGAIAPLTALPAIRARAPGLELRLDGGVRRGTDILNAAGLGASLAFIGRPFVYAATIGGESGARRAIALLKAELRRDLALLGCRSPGEAADRLSFHDPLLEG